MKVLLVIRSQFMDAEPDTPLLVIPEPLQDIDQCGFSCTTWSDECQAPALGQRETDVPQRIRCIFCIAEREVAHLQIKA